MSDLTNLFNSPPAPPPRRSPPPASPLTPARAGPSRSSPSANPLFFSPGSATDTPRRALTSDRRVRSPIFDDSTDDAPPPPDWEDETGEQPESRPDIPGRGDGAVPVPEVPRRNGDFESYMLDPFAGLRGDADGEGEPVKKRRVMAKVDAERLTGDMGIIKLMKAAKRFKVKGKGREAEDLRDLLNVYQMWAHGMFPKGDFVGTMTRVEVVCRTRRMESAMKGYREAFYPRPRTPSPPPVRSASGSPHTPARDLPAATEANGSPDATDMFTSIAQPPFASRNGEEDEDGPDMEELRAMEEMEAMMDKPEVKGVEAEDEFGGLYD